MFTPKLSVIVPVYNVEKYLEKCLNSIINQSYRNLEIICVNDGSTDNSLTILKAYEKKDPRIILIDKENGGLSSARNVGLDVASGEYITFVDSDDYIALNTYELCLNKFNDEVDFVSYSFQYVYTDLTDIKFNSFNQKYVGLHKCNATIILDNSFWVAVWSKIFRKKIIDKYCIRFPEGLIFEDILFSYEYYFISNNAYFLQDNLYYYVQRSDSIMGQTRKTKPGVAIDFLHINLMLLSFLKNMNLFNKHKHVYIRLLIYYFSISIQMEKNILEIKKIRQIALQIIKKSELSDNVFNMLNSYIHDDSYLPKGKKYFGGILKLRKCSYKIRIYILGARVLTIKNNLIHQIDNSFS